jgi:hypothetical protein
MKKICRWSLSEGLLIILERIGGETSEVCVGELVIMKTRVCVCKTVRSMAEAVK